MSLILKTIISVVVCVAIGGLSSVFTIDAINNWYITLQKPSWNPPNYLFGPVWTTLYCMMGIAFARIWNLPASEVRTAAFWLFAVQLFLNFCWSIIFFYWKMPNYAFAEILLMWLAIVATMVYFAKLDRTAMLLLVPYLLWVSFATFLNFTIWRLN